MKQKREEKYSTVIRILIPVLIALCFSTAGCRPTHYVRPHIAISEIKKIAVLPFQNLTADIHADERVRNVVIIELLSRDFEIIEPGEVTSVLRELDIRSLESVSTANIQDIGEITGVDGVLKGSVGTFAMRRGIAVSYPEVTMNLTLLDAKSGKIIWYVWNTAGGASFWTRHFGAEQSTLDDTTRKVVKKAFDTLQ
jgi:hypothetical protein